MNGWKDIKGWEGLYKITPDGKVYSIRNGRFIKLAISRKGYLKARLSLHQMISTYSVARLVAMHFIDNPNKLPQVNHINGVKADDRVNNLEWVTGKQNMIHSYLAGLRRRKTSKYVGICFDRNREKWLAYVQDSISRKNRMLGRFSTEKEAFEALQQY